LGPADPAAEITADGAAVTRTSTTGVQRKGHHSLHPGAACGWRDESGGGGRRNRKVWVPAAPCQEIHRPPSSDYRVVLFFPWIAASELGASESDPVERRARRRVTDCLMIEYLLGTRHRSTADLAQPLHDRPEVGREALGEPAHRTGVGRLRHGRRLGPF
jgi:hypothetical protein